eukprot:CAMPEP_0168405702 /NCGR_PEP_ID=MMETSP0228-20121227/25274_1 /TAXON_ID=133427 /ORGANISM="Protoceratium reticulatum, Strain CCCM 535 (=CCMP 1889)" /LENGTH=205 /DNA_ID=CAMNT_0008419331 /DNA_START=100 /DNA_END=719 /DNA_ORIENTATION=-
MTGSSATPVGEHLVSLADVAHGVQDVRDEAILREKAAIFLHEGLALSDVLRLHSLDFALQQTSAQFCLRDSHPQVRPADADVLVGQVQGQGHHWQSTGLQGLEDHEGRGEVTGRGDHPRGRVQLPHELIPGQLVVTRADGPVVPFVPAVPFFGGTDVPGPKNLRILPVHEPAKKTLLLLGSVPMGTSQSPVYSRGTGRLGQFLHV